MKTTIVNWVSLCYLLSVPHWFVSGVRLPLNPLIPDKNLDAAIKANLPHHKGDLTDKVLADLYRLDASHKEIASLAGLEKCPNLMEVFLADNQIVDLKPLAGLKNLQSLTLSKNRITDPCAASRIDRSCNTWSCPTTRSPTSARSAG